MYLFPVSRHVISMGHGYNHETPTYEKPFRSISAPLPVKVHDLWFAFHDYLTQRGLDSKLADENAWYPSCRAGDSHGRIVIPCSTSSGKVYWQARAINTSVTPRYQSPYTSREDAIVLVFPNKGTYDALQGYTRKVIITEGPLDALAVAGEGYTGVGLMGNKPPKIVLQRLVRMFKDSEQELFLFADSDALGEMSQVMIKLSKDGLRIKLISAPGHKDAASIPMPQRKKILEKLTIS